MLKRGLLVLSTKKQQKKGSAASKITEREREREKETKRDRERQRLREALSRLSKVTIL